jgi:hypothetical protein
MTEGVAVKLQWCVVAGDLSRGFSKYSLSSVNSIRRWSLVFKPTEFLENINNSNNSTIYRLTEGYSKTLPEKTYPPEGTLPTPWFADALDSQ